MGNTTGVWDFRRETAERLAEAYAGALRFYREAAIALPAH